MRDIGGIHRQKLVQRGAGMGMELEEPRLCRPHFAQQREPLLQWSIGVDALRESLQTRHGVALAEPKAAPSPAGASRNTGVPPCAAPASPHAAHAAEH